MTTIFDLPEPEHDELLRSKSLSELIRQEIDKKGGYISFATFMQMALYHPEFGYYTVANFDIGKKGDFTTAPEISPLFARCIAAQILQVEDLLGTESVLEIGAGSGRFAKDLLLELNRQGHLPGSYYIYEISPGLRAKQQKFFREECPDFLHHIKWIDQIPKNFSGTIIANEVLDALPVHRFRIEDGKVKERCVVWKNNAFAWETRIPTTDLLTENVLKIAGLYLPNGYESEINLGLEQFIRPIVDALVQGLILFVDYGYGEKEYYHPARHHGTLTCFYQHRKHDNPLILPGLQDITAHVDFTNVAENAVDQNCSLKGFTSQVSFLLACGLTELVADEEANLSAIEQINLHQAVKLLTFPTEMGERVKVMAFGKKVNVPLQGFGLSDGRREL